MEDILFITDVDEVIVYLTIKRGVLHEPSPRDKHCELTYPNESYLVAKVSTSIYSALIHASELLDLGLVRVYLLEPDCGPGWALVSKRNTEALLYSIVPPTMRVTQ
jgi:hypothetical protein